MISDPSARHGRQNPADLQRRSVTIAGHRTSVSLERVFWQVLDDLARQRGCSLASVIRNIDEQRTQAGTGTLSSAIRVYLFTRRLDGTEEEA